ncbi:nucleotidyltransferase domain-containing protein [Candidatus Micrarchaeota archaeon]|nr:nucleotidyltransferase domain-containing protein [Candidatus Micrarchaeota archaeon]
MLEKYAVVRAIKTILTHPNRRFSITGLAKEAGMAPSAAKYALDYMKAEELVTLEIIGRTHQYKADLGSFLARQWKILFSMQEIRKGRLVEDIAENMENVTSILLYGSIAAGTDDEKSDVDIIVVADTRKTRGAFGKAAIGGRELNVQVYTPMEWRRKASMDKAFYDNVILNSIALYGQKPVVL